MVATEMAGGMHPCHSDGHEHQHKPQEEAVPRRHVRPLPSALTSRPILTGRHSLGVWPRFPSGATRGLPALAAMNGRLLPVRIVKLCAPCEDLAGSADPHGAGRLAVSGFEGGHGALVGDDALGAAGDGGPYAGDGRAVEVHRVAAARPVRAGIVAIAEVV